MWFSLFAVILILAITFYQGLTGVFSAFMMCACTVLAAALAFGTYENLYFQFLIERQPDHGRAIAFMAVFILSLLIMRVIVDLAIRKNMEFHPAVDRAAGGIFGLITALIIIGCLATGFQMLPFYSTFLGFSRYELETPEGETVDPSQTDLLTLDWSKTQLRGPKKIWFSPDGFTVSLVSHLSDNALAGHNRFSIYHPDFLDTLNAARWGMSPKDNHFVAPDVLQVDGYWDLAPGDLRLPRWYEEKGRLIVNVGRESAPDPPSGRKRTVVRATLGPDARDAKGYLFNTWQVRLFGSLGGYIEPYELAGVNDSQFPQYRVQVFPGQVLLYTMAGKATFDFVFEVPDDPQFQPLFLEYKQNARAEILSTHDRTENPPPPLSAEGPPADTDREPTRGPADEDRRPTAARPGTPPRTGQDRISGVGPAQADTRFSDQLPSTLTGYSSVMPLDVSNGVLRSGHLTARLDDDWQPIQGRQSPIHRFHVPQGRSLLQLSVEKLHPESWIGNIYGGIIDTLGDFYIIDTNGRQYRAVGAYAAAEVGGQKTLEIILLDQTARDAGRNLPKFNRIKSSHLTGDYTVVYLFYLPPGTRPKELHTGRQPVRLEHLDLVAPSNSPPS